MTRYYIDSNFLTAFLYENHTNHQKSSDILKSLLIKEDTLIIISTLTFDETWWALHSCSEESRIKSFSDFCEIIDDIYNSIKQDPKLQIIETVNPTELIRLALMGSKKFNLRPRDSFHYAYVKMWDAELLTFDSDFNMTDVKKYLEKLN